MAIKFLDKIESLQPFTDDEAWLIFKIAAISEAVGWTLLISGILTKQYILRGNNSPVVIAGQIHGTIFLAYIVAVAVVYSSLHWSRKKTFIAGLASIPPYGSLIFEQWAAYQRRNEALKRYREVFVYGLIVKGDTVLAVQPKEAGFWYLPGGSVQAEENSETALQRIIQAQTGILPSTGRLVYILQYRHKSVERLELFFNISNSTDYHEQDLKKVALKSKLVDVMQFITLENNELVRPPFLAREHVIAQAKSRNGETHFITPV